jgi:hypothetical protein
MPGAIRRSASERITLEFVKLINSKGPEKALLMALEDGLLGKIISLKNNELMSNIKLISKIDKNLKKLPERLRRHELPQGLNYEGLLRLEGLLIGADKHCFSLSRSLADRVWIVGQLHADYGKLRKGVLFGLFEMSREALYDLLVLSGRLTYVDDAVRFLRIKKRGFLSAEEIMAARGLRSGPLVGRLLAEMKRLQFEGKINDRASARRWLSRAEI